MKVAFLLLVLSGCASGQSAPAAKLPHAHGPARVRIEVSGEGQLPSTIETYISRELRALGDVVVVDAREDFQLSVLAASFKGFDGSAGVAVSLVALRGRELHDYPTALEHWLKTASPDRLREACDQLVAEFDTGVLEPRRKALAVR